MRCAANKVIAIKRFAMELILIIVGAAGLEAVADTGVAVEVIGERLVLEIELSICGGIFHPGEVAHGF